MNSLWDGPRRAIDAALRVVASVLVLVLGSIIATVVMWWLITPQAASVQP